MKALRRAASFVAGLVLLAFTLLLLMEAAWNGYWVTAAIVFGLNILLVLSLAKRLLGFQVPVPAPAPVILRRAVGLLPTLVALWITVALAVQAYGEWALFSVPFGVSIVLVLSLARKLHVDGLALDAIEGGIMAAGAAAFLVFGVCGAVAGLLHGYLLAAAFCAVFAALSGCFLWVAAYEVRRGFARPSSSSI